MLKGAEIYTHARGCLCKIIIPIIATFSITIPSFANIDKNAQSATCDSSTIGTTTGPANLQADWTANTINLDFYSNDTKVGTGTCSYDGAINLPSTPTVPTGYTFGGWRLRAAAAPVQQCSLSGVDWDLGGTGNAYKQLSGGVGPNVNQDVASYGITQPGEWAVRFSYGQVNGVAKCSSKTGDNSSYSWTNDSGNLTALGGELGTTGGACWCKITSFTENDSQCNFVGDTYIYYDSFANYDVCKDGCASGCSRYVNKNTSAAKKFRTAIYSITQ